MRIAIQGEAGSFHAEAVASWQRNQDYKLVYCASFADVFDELAKGQADLALVAVENTIHGPIDEVHQLIKSYKTNVIANIELSISQQLVGLPSTKLIDIATVYSHPVALAQCRQTLQSILPQADLVEYHDTAAAAEFIKNQANPSLAAVASKTAAKIHGLAILQSDIQYSDSNTTYFVGLSITPRVQHKQ